MKEIDRLVNKLTEKLNSIKEKSNIENEGRDLIKEAKFAKLRLERAKADPNIMHGRTADRMTDEELKYYKTLALKTSSEERYQRLKKEWYFHESSSYMRTESGAYDGRGCHNGVCVPECRYYPEYGRIEDEEVESWYAD